ncbi:hypothetical protein BAUCODRAFT_36365 [Baudoinia panamericana UAMH 10762]|uniref:Uncharacterized protein n=1 Tax=Baudoinia panamericana (strain UAMH 10762) TaxID=717646 RepID=M2MR14_BAUPA|nr:uncharacterized protein BAUCODRAFT_36365 [Baudoinia panamericana UAMH 10762]EMC93913.1 hypothetical protein BAUCODRAFT_36365 [Baudoinia panamericana UAMH 10762]
MTTHAPMARVPFAPVDNPRLQHLANAKNRQNGLLASKSGLGAKANSASPKDAFSPNKRRFEPSSFDEDDSENVDPTVLTSPSKKSKSSAFDSAAKPFTFSLTPANSMPPPPTIPSRLSTPARANMASPRAPSTAPAGRSPKRKIAGITKNRRISAPFTRIDPPFASRGSSLPFSLDAALSGTFSTSQSTGATIKESMPKDWFFDIYEDSPEEEAANLMEHSTLTLDISSDEEGSKRVRDDRGKENTPPADYDAPTASRSLGEPAVAAPRHVKKTEIIRRKIVGEEMDDGERSPLSDLETEPFIPEGLDKDSHVLVQPTPEKAAAAKLDFNELFAPLSPFVKKTSTKSATSSLSASISSKTEHDTNSGIIIWEDNVKSQERAVFHAQGIRVNSSKVLEVCDENTAPVEEL